MGSAGCGASASTEPIYGLIKAELRFESGYGFLIKRAKI